MKQQTGMTKQAGKVWLVLLVLILGGAAAWVVLKTAPVPTRVKPDVQARLVEVQPPGSGDVRPVWQLRIGRWCYVNHTLPVPKRFCSMPVRR
jgi:hypothetical protein